MVASEHSMPPTFTAFLMVTLEGAQLSPAAEDFLNYATSADVAEYIAAAGAVAP